MRGLICLLLVAVASAKPGYDYPQPAVPFNPFVPPTTTAPPPPPTTTAPPPPTTTVFVCTPGSQDERCPPDCSPGSTDPRCPPPPPPPTVPSLEYLPPVTTAPPPPPPPPTTAAPPPPPPTTTAPPPPPPPPTTTAPPPPPPTTTVPPPPPTTAFVCIPGSQDERCPPDCYPGSTDPRCPPPPPPPTTTVPPPPPTTAFVCTPGSQDERCPPDCYPGSTDPRCPPPPPPPTTTAPPPPPPPPTTTAPPPPPPVEPDLEYLPPPDTPKEPSGESAVVIVPERTTTSRPAPPPPPPAPVETPSGSADLPVVMDKPAMEMLLWDYKESIPGEPEIDYPILEKIPETKFTCDGRLAGYYADIETRCQVFHVCSFLPEGYAVKNSFLCPNGTLFNQENFACQWWADIDCPTSDQFYKLNENIGKIPDKAQVKRQSPATVGARSFVPDGPVEPAALARSPFSPRQMRLKRKLARENQNL